MQTAAVNRVDIVMVAEAATNNSMNADGTVVQAQVTPTAEARNTLALMQAAAASRVDNVMVADATTDNAINTDATVVESY